MKLFTAIFFTVCVMSVRALVAQDASTIPVPAPVPSDTQPQGTPAPSAAEPAPPLFPSDNPPPIVTRPPHNSGGGGDHTSSTSQNPPARTNRTDESIQNIADNIAYRKAKTKALRDEKVQEALADADAAKSDIDKRAALKRYYTLLADRILKIDGSIKKLVSTRLQASLNELSQSKVRPGDIRRQSQRGIKKTLAVRGSRV